MKREALEIEIGADGRVRVFVKGRKGHRCLELREMFIEMLGPTRSTAYTEEFYEEEEMVHDMLAVMSNKG